MGEESIASHCGDVEGEVDPEILHKIREWTELKKKNIYFNDLLSSSRSYLNPRIIERMIKYLKIDEYETNFQKARFDPSDYTEEIFNRRMVLNVANMSR